MSHENYSFEKTDLDDVTSDFVLHHLEILQNKISELETKIVNLENKFQENEL